MRPWHDRDPGPVPASLAAAARGEAVVELVADGVHLDPGTVSAVFALLGPTGIVLVTDSMAAAGMPDGVYPLGPSWVRVTGGVTRLVDAVASASSTPAAALGRTDIGALEGGRRADLVVVDDDLAPLRVMLAGRWA